MPHFPKPFFRKDRQLWYVQIDGKQHKLGPDRDEAFRRYHELMGQPPEQRFTSDTVAAIVDAYLDWCQKHRSPATYKWYLDRAQAFVDFIPGGLTVNQLKPYHLQRWIDSKDTWADGNKRNACRAIQRAMRWAEQQGYIDRSPIAHFEKPPAGKREKVVSQEEFDSILFHCRDREFRELLIVTWQTGARPQEVRRVEARHVDLQNARWVFPPNESKMGRHPRIVYLTETALLITRRLVLKYPNGPLFRNTSGRPWTTDAVNCRFTTLTKKLGERYCLYVLRHSWATRALQNGVDPLTVSVLMGHADTSTLARTYAHLTQDPTYLQAAAKRATA